MSVINGMEYVKWKENAEKLGKDGSVESYLIHIVFKDSNNRQKKIGIREDIRENQNWLNNVCRS